MAAGTRLEVTNRVSEKIENYILTIYEVSSVSATVGSTKESAVTQIAERLTSSQAEIVVSLKDKRKLSSSDVVQIIKDRLSKMDLEGARVEYALSENVLAMGMEVTAPITIEIKGNKIKELERLTTDIQGGLAKIDGVYGIKNDLSEPSPETKIFIDKDKASLYGLSVVDIAQTAKIALKGFIPTKFKEGGREYDIRVRLKESDRDNLNKLGYIQLQSPMNMRIPLSGVATFGVGKGPSEIKRSNQERVVMVYANVYNRAMKDVIADVNKMIKGIDIPKDYTVKLTGQTEEMKQSFQSLQFALIAAILLVYMIMAAAFESLWQPFIILFTIPLSLIGVAWSLFLTGTSVSAYVLMGVGILAGIVVDNAIVLIDCLNLFRSQGMNIKDAAIRASNVRLRPILMTAITTILGLLPMAFLGGKGAELRAPMALTTMGGLTASTFLTLIVIPVIYLSWSELIERLFKRKR
jgi:HAE1 family hydrophobic/amphiphilic exporter-1